MKWLVIGILIFIYIAGFVLVAGACMMSDRPSDNAVPFWKLILWPIFLWQIGPQ